MREEVGEQTTVARDAKKGWTSMLEKRTRLRRRVLIESQLR